MGLEDLLLGAEYDGEQWHGEDRSRPRRGDDCEWITSHRSWHLEVFRKDHVFGPQQDVERRLRIAYDACASSTRTAPDVPSSDCKLAPTGLKTGAVSA